MCGDVPYYLCHGSRPSYKHIKLWFVRFYITNGRVTGEKLDDRPHRAYFMVYEATTGVIISTWIKTTIFLTTEPIMLGLMNIIRVSTYKTSTLPVLYSFNKILKVLFIIWTSSNLFHVNLILHTLHFVYKNSHMEFSYLLLERKLALIYSIMNILQSLISLIQSQIHQTVVDSQHRLKKMCGS